MDVILDILKAGSIIIACWVAILGINAWKKEFIGKRRIELAENVLAKFFELRDAISFIRSPWQKIDEGTTRKREPNETPNESRLLDRAYVVVERYEAKERIFAEFNIL